MYDRITRYISLAALTLLCACQGSNCFWLGPTPPAPIVKHERCELLLSAVDRQMVDAQNAFSLKMLSRVAEQDPHSCMLSPLSAEMVLAMLAGGAEGETAEEIRAALGLDPFAAAEVDAYHDRLITALPYLDSITQMTIANALWLDQGFEPQPLFVSRTQRYYHADVEVLELSDASSAGVINAWADKATNHLIRKVLDGTQCRDDLRMVVANALYFKGYWEHEFRPEATRKEVFYATDAMKETDMMNMTSELLVTPNEGKSDSPLSARMLRLYYRERGYEMDVLLPDEDSNVSELLASLTTESLAAEENQLTLCQVELKLPKFTSRYERLLNADMQAMGIKRLFSSEDAQLGALSEQEKLYLGLLKQYTYISVDERGTEAAAVTVGMVGITSVEPVRPPVRFYANRPFVYFIRDARYGIILFAGIFNE